LKQQKNWRICSLLLLPAVPQMTSAARAARGHWVHGACTDALASVCPATAPSTDDIGPDDALQPGLLSASWAAPKQIIYNCASSMNTTEQNLLIPFDRPDSSENCSLPCIISGSNAVSDPHFKAINLA
jgi:hypothetical protein